MTFEGPVWEDLYARFGTSDTHQDSNWGLLGLPYAAIEVNEMKRIGVPYREAIKATVSTLARKDDFSSVAKLVSNLVLSEIRSVEIIVEVVKHLCDIQFLSAIRHLAEVGNHFHRRPYEWYWEMRVDLHPLSMSERTFCSLLPHKRTNMLGQFVYDFNHDVHLGLVEYLMDSGMSDLHPPEADELDSPMLLALLGQTCLPVMELMAQRNADFGHVGSGNTLGIPDTLFVAMYHNPNLIPFLLKIGGMAMEVPVFVSPSIGNNETYRVFVCCELRRFRGMLELMAEFSLILPLCATCKEASHLESSIPSLQSMCRMVYRSQFSPSQLLVDEPKTPENYPDFYCEYLRFEDSPFDSTEFRAAMSERNAGKYQSPKDFLLSPEEDAQYGLRRIEGEDEDDDESYIDSFYDLWSDEEERELGIDREIQFAREPPVFNEADWVVDPDYEW